MNDFDIAKICFELYSGDPINDNWDHLWPHDGGFVAQRRIGDVDVVVWRGSSTGLDWLEDLDFTPINDPQLGYCHGGFYKGAAEVWDHVDVVLGANVIVTGHSLGAAHAMLHGARRMARGHKPVKIVVAGAPRPGYQKLAGILEGVSASSYRNGNDPVTAVPLTLPSFPFVEPYAFTQIDVAPSLGDSWGIFSRHHWNLYLQGIEAFVKDQA